MATGKEHFLMESLRSGQKSNDRPHRMNRFMGGHARKTQPYVGGYWYFMLLTPDTIFGIDSTITKNPGADITDLNSSPLSFESNTKTPTTDMQFESDLWFHSTAESFTPPTTNLTKIDIPGMGGIGSSFIGGREITRTFTVAFREYTNLPIMTALNKWTSVMDPYLGVSSLHANEWMPAAYKGVACAFLCKPTVSNDSRTSLRFKEDDMNGSDIEQMYYFDGVWPESAPNDSFNSDIATNDSLQLSVSFSFDGWAYNKEAFGKEFGTGATDMFNARYGLEEIIEHIKHRVLVNKTLGAFT